MLANNLLLLSMLILGLIAGNRLVSAASGCLLLLQILQMENLVVLLSDKAIDWGLILLLIAILAPIAEEPPHYEQLVRQLRTPATMFAVVGGAAATRLQGSGLHLLQEQPQIVLGLLIGTIVGVFFLDGIPVGPLTGAGLTAGIMLLFRLI